MRADRGAPGGPGRLKEYPTVRFCNRMYDAPSTQRDEKMAGSRMSVGSLRASRRKFLPCSALLLVEYTSAVLLNTSCPNAPRIWMLKSNLPRVTVLCRPSEKS